MKIYVSMSRKLPEMLAANIVQFTENVSVASMFGPVRPNFPQISRRRDNNVSTYALISRTTPFRGPPRSISVAPSYRRIHSLSCLETFLVSVFAPSGNATSITGDAFPIDINRMQRINPYRRGKHAWEFGISPFGRHSVAS